MSACIRCGLLVLLVGTLAACSSGSSSPTCSFDDPAALAASSPWPKFHRDQENTGTVVNANLSSNPGTCRWVFPPGDRDSCTTALSTPPKGAFVASPVISGDGKIYIGSADGTLYALDAEHGTQIASSSFSIASSITSAALVATRPVEGEVVFVGASDGYLYGLTDSGVAQPTYWPSAVSGMISGSPNIGADGTVYVASLAGMVAGVCPNGIGRFTLSAGGSLYSPTRGPDGTLYFGGDDHLLRAVQADGTLEWSFSAAGAISTAPAFDTDTNSVYVTDRSGRCSRSRRMAAWICPTASPSSAFNFRRRTVNQGPPAGFVRHRPWPAIIFISVPTTETCTRLTDAPARWLGSSPPVAQSFLRLPLPSSPADRYHRRHAPRPGRPLAPTHRRGGIERRQCVLCGGQRHRAMPVAVVPPSTSRRYLTVLGAPGPKCRRRVLRHGPR